MQRMLHIIFLKRLHPVCDQYRISLLKIFMLVLPLLLLLEIGNTFYAGAYTAAVIEGGFLFFIIFSRKMWDNTHYFGNAFIRTARQPSVSRRKSARLLPTRLTMTLPRSTVSIGKTVHVFGGTAPKMYHRANQALYVVKSAGRDRVETI